MSPSAYVKAAWLYTCIPALNRQEKETILPKVSTICTCKTNKCRSRPLFYPFRA